MLYTCAIFSDSCEYSRYVLKWFMFSTCDNCELVLTYSGLGHLALCCLQTKVQPHLLVTSTLLCIPLRHKISGYEGIISVLISDKPPCQQHWIDTSRHNPFTVLMNCLMFKAVTDVYIYKSEYKWLWSNEINVKDSPVLPPITRYEYQFCFHDMYFT